MLTWAAPSRMSSAQWADRFRYLAVESAERHGKYSATLTPWVPGILDALDDRNTWKIICMKAGQIAWTDGVLNNWLGRCIDLDPTPIIGLFPKEGTGKQYSDEKFAPMVTATPVLANKVDVRTSRKDGNSKLFKKFPGGFLKFVGSNSPSNVKSTPAPRVFVEEPDDASINVGKQGDSIKLLEERTKTYARRKVVYGGTPSVKGLSTIEESYELGDRRQFLVPCHDCNEAHALRWENVQWAEDETRQPHPIYGKALPETAFYACPHCGSCWNDTQKNRNVRQGHWQATAPFRGIASFHLNELYAPWEGSKLARLVERFLEAQHRLDLGDDTEMIVFVNSALGLPYEYKGDQPEAEVLAELALEYPEKTIPVGGLILTAGVDVQQDRLAVIIRAWGRQEESWLIYWGELAGNPGDSADPVWDELNEVLDATYRHTLGGSLSIRATSIDTSDGNTSDAVYKYVRRHMYKGVLAIKGASKLDKEIFSLPEKIDTDGSNTKVAKYGLKLYSVGTQKAKDLIASRIALKGHGQNRMHVYKDVRADYWDQMTSEVKAPHRSIRNKKVWQKRSGRRNEALDCEVYALHAARFLKVHIMREVAWSAIEEKLRQPSLFEEQAQPQKPANAAQQNPQQAPGNWLNNRGNWLS